MAKRRRFTAEVGALTKSRTLFELAKNVGVLFRDIIDSLGGIPTPHADTHKPDRSAAGGYDPLATAAPSNPTGTAAAEGTAGTLMRSDATIMQGIVQQKGDVLGYSNVPARVPVGANGEVLTADSTQALGVKWAPAAAAAETTLTRAEREQRDAEIRSAYDSLVLRDMVARTYRR